MRSTHAVAPRLNFPSCHAPGADAPGCRMSPLRGSELSPLSAQPRTVSIRQAAVNGTFPCIDVNVSDKTAGGITGVNLLPNGSPSMLFFHSFKQISKLDLNIEADRSRHVHLMTQQMYIAMAPSMALIWRCQPSTVAGTTWRTRQATRRRGKGDPVMADAYSFFSPDIAAMVERIRSRLYRAVPCAAE